MRRRKTPWRWRAVALFAAVALAPACGAPTASAPPGDAADAAPRIIAAARASKHAWDRLAELCDLFGPRPAGSPAYARAADWALAEMKKDGLANVHREDVTIHNWERGAESLVLLEPNGPRPLPMLGLGRSVGTPPEGVTAPVVVVHDFADLDRAGDKVKGKIVAYNFAMRERPGRSPDYGEAVAYRWSGASRAARHGAVAVLVRSITTARWRVPHTGAMGYDADAPKIPAAAITVEDAEMLQRLADRGAPVVVRLTMGARSGPDVVDANVVGESPGRERADEMVVVGGHLDSWDQSCGAHDNASGAVMAMEAVRLLVELKLQPRRTVRVVLFANEERGLEGGRGYREAHLGSIRQCVAALEADSGAFAPRGFSFQGAPAAAERIEALLPLFHPMGELKLNRGGSGADISPLVADGVPGLGLMTKGEHYFDYHHSAADTPDKVEPAALNDDVAAFALMTWLLAETPGTLPRQAPAPQKPD